MRDKSTFACGRHLWPKRLGWRPAYVVIVATSNPVIAEWRELQHCSRCLAGIRLRPPLAEGQRLLRILREEPSLIERAREL